jgi:hypothetical protein
MHEEGWMDQSQLAVYSLFGAADWTPSPTLGP